MSPWLICLLVLLGGGLLLAGIFYWTARRRDLVRRPVEKRVGYGTRGALLIYQPSNRGKNHAIAWALARTLARTGYTVTLNYPSPGAQLRPPGLRPVYLRGQRLYGGGGPAVEGLPLLPSFQGKQVLLFVVGDLERAPELAGLRLCVPEGNRIRSIKIRPSEERSCASLPWDEPLHFPQGVSKIMSAGQGAPRSAQRAERSVDGPP